MCLWFSARVCSHKEFRKWLLWVNVLTILEDAEVNQRVIGHEGRGLYRKWIEAAIPHYWQRSILWCPFWEHPPFNRWILLHDCLRPFVCNNKRYMNAAEGRKFQINTSSFDSHVRYLLPGYFIVKGVERVLMMQEQARDRTCWREIYRVQFCQHRCCFGKPLHPPFRNETKRVHSHWFLNTRKLCKALMNRIVVEYDSKKTLQAFVTSHSAVTHMRLTLAVLQELNLIEFT